MDADAPRSEERQRAVAALQRGVGVVVVGEAGSGRTRFLQGVLAEVDPLVRPRIWVGDEVHRLDADQAERLARAITGGKIVPLVTASTRFPMHADLERLCRDGIVVRVELTPLPAAAVLAVVEDILGAPLHLDSVPAFVPRRPGGDLVVLSETVRHARASGVLAKVEQAWRLTAPPPPHDGLRRVVLSRLTPSVELDAASVAVLDLLGLAPELGLNAVREISRDAHGDIDDVLERLEGDGLIDALAGGAEPRLRIHDPLIELVLPQTIGTLRRDRLTSRLVEALGAKDPAALPPGELAALAKFAHPLGRSVDARCLTRAAEAALETSRAELALRLASAASEHGGGFDANLVLAAAESQLGWSSRARERLSALAAETAGDSAREAARIRLMAVVEGRIGDPTFGWNLPSGSRIDETTLDLASYLRIDSTRDRTPAADSADEERLHIVLEGDRLAQEATVALIQGDFGRARAFLDAGEVLLTGAGADTFQIRLRRIMTNSLDGTLTEGISRAAALRDDATTGGHAVHRVMAEWLRGELLLYAGRADEACSALEATLIDSDRMGMDRAALMVRAELATALAQRGDLLASDAVLEPALRTPDDAFGGKAMAIEASAWILACSGRMTAAAETFIRAAEENRRLGRALAHVVALNEAARAGAARRVVDDIDTQHDVVQGMNALLLIRQVHALAAAEEVWEHVGDGVTWLAESQPVALEFESTGSALVAAGLHLHAAEAFWHAAALHERAGRSREAASCGRRAADQLEACGVAASPFAGPHQSTALSARESDIAARARAGQSNRQIAEDLVLSVRTVETHLQRVYRKLGVRGRSELSEALPGVMPDRTGASGIAID
jgi:DNA-binding CsgD family transcriptional regulator